ncbi:hypothetical protein D3C86_1974680 [compost metagenome]
MHETLKDLLLQGLWNNEKVRAYIGAKELEVENGTDSAFEAAEEIYRLYKNTNQ